MCFNYQTHIPIEASNLCWLFLGLIPVYIDIRIYFFNGQFLYVLITRLVPITNIIGGSNLCWLFLGLMPVALNEKWCAEANGTSLR